MKIFYFPSQEMFQVKVDDTTEQFTLQIADRHGVLLQWEDLFLGAQIDVLGRPTTLHKASLETLEWLEHSTRKMLARKKKLEEALVKFRHVRLTEASRFVPDTVRVGKTNLRKLSAEIAILQESLAVFRPPRPAQPAQ